MIMRIWKKKALSALEPEGISPLAYPECMRWQVVLLLPPGPVASSSQVIPPSPPPPPSPEFRQVSLTFSVPISLSHCTNQIIK